KIGIIERLVRRGVSLDAGRDDITPLIAAATGRQTTTVTRLVELGARVDGARSTDGATALHIAAGEGSVDVLTALLDAGADPNGADALGWPPLAFAIRNDQPDTLSALLAREARADFSVGAWSLLTLASIHNRKPIARTLMDHGAVETIYIATWLGRFDRLKAMLRKAPVALNQNGPDGLGLLHQAVRARSPKLVRYLLRKGARWDQWSDSVIDGEKTLPSWTPLHFAVFQGSAGLAVLLIEGGGDPFAQDDSGETPFAYADRIKPESRPMMKSAISRWKTKHSDDAMGTTEAIEWEGPSPNPAAAVGALGAIKSPTRSGRASGGIQLRERILDQDILVRSLLNGPDDKEGPADGHETQIRHCTRSTAYRAALRHTGDLLALRKKWEPSKSLTIAMSHHNLGRLSHYLARYDDAKRYLTMALGALSVRVLTGETTQASRLLLKATVLENLANLSAVLGDYGAAEEGFLTVLGVIEASAYRSPARLALTHSNLGNLYTEMGRYDDAEKAHRIALKLREDSFRPEATGVAASLNNLAAVLTIVGEHVRAEALYLRAHGLLEGVAAWVAADQLALAKFNVARGALRRGEWKPAEALVRAALEILLEAYSDGHYAVGRVQLGLAHALSALGRHDEAAKAVDAALPALRQAHGELHGFVARGLLLRSEIATQLGDLAAAEAALREALAIAYAADAPEERWPVEFAYGQRLLASGDTRRGIVFLKQAVNTLQGMRASLSGARSQSYAADRTAPYRLLADRLIVDGRLPEATQVLAMLKEEELARFATRSLAKLKAVVRNADFLPSEEAWLGRFRTIRDDLTALGTEFRKLLDKRRLGALTASGRSRLAALRKDLAIGRRAFDAFLSAIRKEVAATNLVRAENLAGRNLASLRAMQGVLKKLGHGAVLVHYLVTETGLRVLITTPDVQVARESKIPRAELNRLIADFRHALEDPETDVLPLAGRLYDVVVAPIADDLAAAEAKTLMLSLDGALRYVPFDALHDGDRFMLERYRLAHFTDASKPHLTAERPADWRIAALGLSMQHPGFDALPAVPAELHGIVKTKKAGSDGVSPGIVRLDADFTAATFQAALEDGFPVVHIASHFVFKPGTERDSFLLLGDAQQLTLDSIRYEGFAFDDVSLLTLSACNTAVGVTDVTAGSEVEGFAAMTQKLGVKSVVATLWPVADASTGQFMREMYARYGSAESTMTKADAVRQAKLTLLRGTVDLVQSDRLPQGHLPARDSDEEPAVSEGDFAHPYYWAPFVLMGNWL
ncbi:MAG: CHAT domain-containing protein/ankyrin repeat protein, partial [Myxococcota bacterium]